MRKTETYQLNQWELNDRIRMEDFNADNTRLESILTGKLGGFQKIYSYSPGNGKNSDGAALFIKDWSQWECVMVTYDLHETQFLEGDNIQLAMMHSSEFSPYFKIPAGGSFFLLLFPLRDETATVRGLAVGSGSCAIFTDQPFETLTGVALRLRNASCNHPDGGSDSVFTNPVWTVYGLK